MRRKNIYDELISQRFSQVPVPDMEASWREMKKLLDRKKRDRPIPFFFLPGCASWVLLTLLLTVPLVTWMIFRKPTAASIVTVKKSAADKAEKRYITLFPSKTKAKILAPRSVNNASTMKKAGHYGKNNLSGIRKNYKQSDSSAFINSPVRLLTADTGRKNASSRIAAIMNKDKDTTSSLRQTPEIKQRDNQKIYFTAGVGLNQNIPFNGQSAVPYNFYGRKGSLADYIPSVYFQIHVGAKWWLQAGFQFGAPQLVKEFTYDNHLLDSSAFTVTKRTLSLRKTFYHQFPLSVNYAVSKHFSVNTGVEIGRFYSAVSDEEIHATNLITRRDSLIDKNTIATRASADSFFSRTILTSTFGLSYHAGRFSVGARYSLGITPFIKYAAANREAMKKNNSLQLQLTYRLWQSGKR